MHNLLTRDESIRTQIVAAFGKNILNAEGHPDRVTLRERVFANAQERSCLESILHPAVRRAWQSQVTEGRKTGAWQLIDIPLLFETGVQSEFDCTVVVAAPRVTQLHRMVQDRGLAPLVAERILAAQLDLGIKITQADHVIWNDSTVSNLDGQIRLLAAWLKRRFAGL